MLSLLVIMISADLMLDMVNQQRRANGKASLVLDVQCNSAAQVQANDQASHLFMGHVGSDGSTVGVRLSRTGFNWNAVAENAAEGYNTVEEVMTGWMNSAGHRENILNAAYSRFGYSQSKGSDGKIYWTQVFAHPQNGFTPTDASAPSSPAPVINNKPAQVQVQDQKKDDKPAQVQVQDQKKNDKPAQVQVQDQKKDDKPTQNTSQNASQPPLGDIINQVVQVAANLGFSISNLPADIQAVLSDYNQYSFKILAYLKDRVPVASNIAKYYFGHPGATNQFDTLTWSFYTQ